VKRFSMRVCVLVFACLAGLAICRADELAAVTGLVTDPNGRSVPGVTVIITNLATNVVSRTVTNDQGIYRVPSLQPGIYRMTLDKDGFKSIVKSGVELHVQDVASINFELQIGSVNETVTVEAGGLVINTTDGSVSTVIDQKYVKNMPLNGRSFQDLILLTPGVVTNSPQDTSFLGSQGEFSVNGQRTEANNYTVDGVSANVGASPGTGMINSAGASGSVPAATAVGTTQALVSVDDLQEFRVQSSSYSAEYGRNPGGQFAFETKSGTNGWHGTAYEYLRNGFTDAQDWFSDYFGLPQPPIRQNDFGGTFGGRVIKDRTFFFISYEGLRLVASRAATPSFVPDTYLRTHAPAAIAQALNAWPMPSPNGIDDPVNHFAQFIGTWSNPSSLNSTSVRFDHAVSSKLKLFFRFADTRSNAASRFATSPTMNDKSDYTLRTYTAGGDSALSNRLSNSFRLNYSSNEVAHQLGIDSFGGNTPVDLAKLTNLGPNGRPWLDFIYGGYNVQLFQQQDVGLQRQWNAVDTISLALGRHLVKFGADYRGLTPYSQTYNPLAFYQYLSEAAVETNKGTVRVVAFAPIYPLYQNFSAFGQDEWKVSPRLNLSMGIRWEVNPAPGVTQGVKPYTVQGSGPSTWNIAPQGTPLWHTAWYNFAPRLGIAYVLNNTSGRETVVRVGGGVFYDTGQNAGSYGAQGPGLSATTGRVAASFPSLPATPTIVNPPVSPYVRLVPIGYSSHLQLPYTLHWNASVEQALGRSQSVTLSYVGSHAARLLKFNDFLTRSNPNASEFQFFTNGLTSDYDSMQLQVRRRLNSGLTALASYSWAHCLDQGSLDFRLGYQRGNCDFDVRHNLSAAFSYDLPNVGRGRFIKAVLHGWGLDDRFSARTGFPITLNGLQSFDPITGQASFSGLDLLAGQSVYLYGANCTAVLQGLGDLKPGSSCPGGRAVNPNAFAFPPIDPKTFTPTRLGNAPRNFVRGFGAWQMDMSVRRDFPIREGLTLQFRAEAFNIFNHPNFGTVDANFGSKTFGQATGTLANGLGVLSPLYQMGGPRSLQFALKLSF
jgi:hypothetical protein